MKRSLVIACALLAACVGERPPDGQRETAAESGSAPADSVPARGDSMMARDTATP